MASARALLGQLELILTRFPWAEVAATVCLVGGWLLITWSIASVVRAWQVWSVSAGLFLLSLFGFRFLGEIAWRGFYDLTRERPGRRR